MSIEFSFFKKIGGEGEAALKNNKIYEGAVAPARTFQHLLKALARMEG
jgi:hypothetical protein